MTMHGFCDCCNRQGFLYAIFLKAGTGRWAKFCLECFRREKEAEEREARG